MRELVPFTDLLSKIVDNRGKTCPTSDEGIPLIATNCIGNEQLYPTYEKVRYVSDETYATWFRGHPKPGDLIFVTKGTPGRVCLTPEPVDFCIAQDMVALRADEKKVYPKFLFALLRSPEVQEKIGNMHVGSLIPHFKKGDFHKLMLCVPERHEQEFIGDLYFDLCQKIELNRRQNATLEAMAQRVFRAWFVDFEPVRAKVAGIAPACLDPETAALFPDEWEIQNGQEIPKGWKVEPLDGVAQFLNGLALQKFPPVGDETDLPVIKISQLRKGSTDADEKANSKIAEQYKIKNGDVLFSWSGTLEVRVWNGGEGALNQHLFKVTSERFPKWFYYFWTLHHLAKFREIAANKATTMGHIQRHHLTEAKVWVPNDELLARLDEIIAPLLAQIENNLQQSRTLAGIRDQLLPRLLSGALRVPESSLPMDADATSLEF